MKVKHTTGEEKGREACLGFHEAQAALVAGAVEPISEIVTDFPTANAETDAVPASDAGPDLNTLTRSELDKLAAERGVDISQAKTKSDVIEALRAA